VNGTTEAESGASADRRPVGWYIHHHGAGHLTRFLAVRPHLGRPVVAFSSLPRPADLPAGTVWVELPRDDGDIVDCDGIARPAAEAHPTAHGVLHWAPIAHLGHAERLATIAAALGERRFAAFVVDVSAEVTTLVRLLGVPTVIATQPGERTDAPHRLAFDLADRVIAPWTAGTHRSEALDRIADRVEYVGGISRFDGRVRAEAREPGTVLVLGGAADSDLAERVDAAAITTPGWRWDVIGGSPDSWVADPWQRLQRAEIVVTAAGQNSIADLAAARAKAVVIAQDRPFDEQRATARRLDESGLAVVLDAWPDPRDWPDVLHRARALSPRWADWRVDGAARRAAAVVEDVAAWSP
jgi:hypothetical protein